MITYRRIAVHTVLIAVLFTVLIASAGSSSPASGAEEVKAPGRYSGVTNPSMQPRESEQLIGADIAATGVRFIHVLAAVMWIGGHLFLTFFYPAAIPQGPGKTARLYQAYRTFSRWIIPVFLILIASGFYQNQTVAPAETTVLEQIPFGIYYVQAIGIKLMLAFVAAIIGALTSFMLLKALGRRIENGEGEAADKELSRVKIASLANLVIGIIVLYVATTLPRSHMLVHIGLQ